MMGWLDASYLFCHFVAQRRNLLFFTRQNGIRLTNLRRGSPWGGDQSDLLEGVLEDAIEDGIDVCELASVVEGAG